MGDTEPRTLIAQPLAAAAFAPYGDVIERRGMATTINQGKGRRYRDLAAIDFAADGRAAASLMTCVAETPPVPLRLLERHPEGNQVFMPLDGQRYIVVVAPPGAPPAPEALRAFLCNPDQGVNYHRGTWHHPMIALADDCTFFELHWQGPRRNCEEIALAAPIVVALPAAVGATP